VSTSESEAPKKAYHHGGLRAALVAAGLQLIEARTADDLSLREVARAVGAPDAPDFAPTRPGELHSIVLDVGQARRALGWEPAVGLRQGLAQTVDWVRSQKH